MSNSSVLGLVCASGDISFDHVKIQIDLSDVISQVNSAHVELLMQSITCGPNDNNLVPLFDRSVPVSIRCLRRNEYKRKNSDRLPQGGIYSSHCGFQRRPPAGGQEGRDHWIILQRVMCRIRPSTDQPRLKHYWSSFFRTLSLNFNDDSSYHILRRQLRIGRAESLCNRLVPFRRKAYSQTLHRTHLSDTLNFSLKSGSITILVKIPHATLHCVHQ
jgi:hypothetical protein